MEKYFSLSIYSLGWAPSAIAALNYAANHEEFKWRRLVWILVLVLGQIYVFSQIGMRTNAIMSVSMPGIIMIVKYTKSLKYRIWLLSSVIVCLLGVYAIVSLSSNRLNGNMRLIQNRAYGEDQEWTTNTKVMAVKEGLWRDLTYRSALATYSATYDTARCLREDQGRNKITELSGLKGLKELVVNDAMSTIPSDILRKLNLEGVRTNAYRTLRSQCYMLRTVKSIKKRVIVDTMDAKGQELILLADRGGSILMTGIYVFTGIICWTVLTFLVSRLTKGLGSLWVFTVFTSASTVSYGSWIQMLITIVPVLLLSNICKETYANATARRET